MTQTATKKGQSSREPVMKGYQESGLVAVLPDAGQTLRNELRFHLLTSYDDLHPRLQVQNTAICLCPLKHIDQFMKMKG